MSSDARRELLEGGRPCPLHRAHHHLDRRSRSSARLAVARDGYVVSIEELEHGLTAVAAPIRDHTGMVIAALSVSGPVYRLTEERAKRSSRSGASAAASVAERMGYQG